MKSLFYYLIQVVVVSGILYAYYHVALRNKKFHQYNRFYILGATLASILIPFLNIPVYFSNEDPSAQWMYALQNLSAQPVVIVAGAEEETPFDWHVLLYGLYALIALAGLARIILSVYRLKKIMRQHPAEHLNGIRFINTAEPGTPFSFFRWLFWNNRIELSSQKGEQIFRHEIFHIEQKHSLDSVFMEMISIVFWINPFFLLMKKELKAIHEFLADRFASSETEKWEYAEMLLMQALNTQHSLVHPFFHNQIKRRIAMITNPQKTSHQYLRKMLVLPLAALLITLFAFSYKQKQADPLPDELSIFEVPVSQDTTGLLPQIQVKEYRSDKTTVKAEKIVINAAATFAKDGKPEPGLIIFNGKQFTRDEFGKFISTRNSTQLVVEAETVIETSANDPKAISKYGERAVNGVLEFKNAHLDTVPAKPPVRIRLSGNLLETEKQPLIVLDGVVKENDDYQATLSQINPENIKAITVLKDSSAANLYGSKGKNGVLLITTKLKADQSQPTELELKNVKIVGTAAIKKDLQLKQGQPLEEVVVEGYPTKKVAGVQIEAVPAQKNQLEEVTVVGYGTKKIKDLEIKEEPVKGKIEEVTVVGRPSRVGLSASTGNLDVEPAFPGGANAWYNFLVKNLDAAAPVKKGAPEGLYTIYIRMKVDKSGRISDFKPLTNHGFGMEDAAINALEKSPYWNPGYQKGEAVNSYKIQPFTFSVVSDKVSPKTEIGENTTTIYPNPVKDNLSVQFNSKKNRTVGIRIVDMSGKVYSTSELKLAKGTTTSSISTAELAPGTYLLRLSGEDVGKNSSFKFVKE